MYEANITFPAGESPGRRDAFGADGLRPLNWEELVARLAAGRDFRRIVRGRLGTGGASFDFASARHLTHLGDVKPAINPFALANGKIADGMGFADAGDHTPGVRGRQ